jgi:hypothetical protein
MTYRVIANFQHINGEIEARRVWLTGLDRSEAERQADIAPRFNDQVTEAWPERENDAGFARVIELSGVKYVDYEAYFYEVDTQGYFTFRRTAGEKRGESFRATHSFRDSDPAEGYFGIQVIAGTGICGYIQEIRMSLRWAQRTGIVPRGL